MSGIYSVTRASRISPTSLFVSVRFVLFPALLSTIYPVQLCAQQIAAETLHDQAVEVVVSGERLQQPTEGTSSYAIRRSNSATKMDLSLRETPQSVSVVTRDQMDDFKLDNINQVLAGTTGVTVEKVETDRTYYTARGFDITNFQFDGIGAPLTFGDQFGDLDTAMYDRIEVVRGANGLISSTGNPSATINFIRKRPTQHFQASADLSVGSWDTHRIAADLSGPVNNAGTLAARLVASQQDGHSYLDRYQPARSTAYGVLEANLGENTLLTVGHSYQQNNSRGAMWGALPMYYSDGSATNYAVNTSTAADWSYWNTNEQRSFAELDHYLANDWLWRTTVSYNQLSSDGKLLYVYGTPDKTTGSGLFAYPSVYQSENNQSLMDSYLNGKYMLGGRKHDFTVGASWSRSTLNDVSYYGQGIGTPLTVNDAFNGSYPEPLFNASSAGSAYVDRRQSIYAATRFNLTDQSKLLIGTNYVDAISDGNADNVSHQMRAIANTPYIGLVVNLNATSSVYASYAEIFNPQYQTDINGVTLPALQGKNYEAGLKSEFFSKKINASAAVFKVEQNNTAELAGYNGNMAYYRAINANSQGVELDLSGDLTQRWKVSMGLTSLRIKDDQGNPARTYVPDHVVRLATVYRPEQLEHLKIGASLNWQSQTSYQQTPTIETIQRSYALLNVMAHYDITPAFSVQVNLNNITNQKFIASLYWSQMYYGAPFHGSVALHWKF